jgi:uncharacterized protein (TIGR03067 family)
MNRCILTALAFLFALCAPALQGGEDAKEKAKKEAVQKELQRLEGTWQCRWVGRNGQKFEAQDDPIIIKGGKWFVGEKAVASFTIDTTTSPKLIDLTDLLEAKGLKAEGIYKLDGDQFVICLHANEGVRQRPLEFVTEPGSEKFLFWFERVKP